MAGNHIDFLRDLGNSGDAKIRGSAAGIPGTKDRDPGIGIPAVRDIVATNRMSGAVNDVVTSLHLSRAEAGRRSAQSVMCATTAWDSPAATCENGNLIDCDTDATDFCVLTVTPRWSGPFTLEVRNLGRRANLYEIRLTP